MKIGVIGDVHWSKYSSIIRSRGSIYSTRLENCIKSVNWAEETTKDCDIVVYLGDFFDNESLKSEELTALNELKWNDKKHIFLVGNHELGLNNLIFSSAHIFNIADMEVIDKPQIIEYDYLDLCFLPYILDNTGNINDYIPKKTNLNTRIYFSHNDLAGVYVGNFVSKIGFNTKDIENDCSLFLNGHLHNATKVDNKIYNVGNLTGQNFSEDASVYNHGICILDTDTCNLKRVENPYAFNFFKIHSIENLLNYEFPLNSVITAKLNINSIDKAKEYVNSNDNIIAHRFIIDSSQNNDISTIDNISLSVNHLDRFQEFVFEKLGTGELVKEELSKIIL